MEKLSILLFVSLAITNCAFGQVSNEKLYQAVVKQDTAAVWQALNRQADPNYVKASGPWMKASMLTTAINNRDVAMVKILLTHRADVDWKDGFNTTGLMYAAALGSKELTVLLLAAGADARASDGKGNTVLSAAVEGKNEDVVRLIQDKLDNRTAP